MSLLDMVLDESPFLSDGEKHVAKRTERVRHEILSKLGELRALHARHASDAAKRPTVQELMKLIRDAMVMIDSKELRLAREEAQRWWDEMTASCRPATKAALAAAAAAAPTGRGGAVGRAMASRAAGAVAGAASTADLAGLPGTSTPGALSLAASPADALDGVDRTTRYIDWGMEPLESVPFEQIDFDEAKFKELCVNDKAGARTMGTAAMKRVLALTSDRIFHWANEAKLQMCEGKWPKGDSLRSWVLRPALPEGRESTLTVKIAYSNSAKAFLVHSTRLPRRNSSRRTAVDAFAPAGLGGLPGMASMSPYMTMPTDVAPLTAVAPRRIPAAAHSGRNSDGEPDSADPSAKRARAEAAGAPTTLVASILVDGEAAGAERTPGVPGTPGKSPAG